MKKGWEMKNLGDLCEIFADGDWVESKDQSSEGIRLIQTGNVGEGAFKDRSEKARYISETTFNRLRCTEIFEGDCLVSRLPDPVGRSCILPDTGERMITAVDCTILRFHSKVLLPKFFNFYSQSDDYLSAIAKKCTGTTRNRVSRSNLGLTPIPVPPLAEQQRIVGLLDEAFEGLTTAKAHAQKNLQNARALFESHLQSVLRNKKWKWKTLGELCDDVEYGSSAKSKAEGGVPVLRMGNIQDGRIDWENLVYTDDKTEIKKYLLKHNDVLFNRTNSPELVGKTAIYKSEMPAIFAGYLIRIHRKEDLLHGDYLAYFLNSQIAFDYGKTVVISSVNQANINGTKLKSYPIPAPSLAEQKAIVAKLDKLSEQTQRLAALYEQKLAALEALKKSLLHQAFSGEL
jgi:type I restriction enzyme S subunit